MPYELHCGDSLEVLRQLPDCSVDSVVTDPPAGIAFLSRGWDRFQSRADFENFLCTILLEANRVLKPGGYMLVWAIPRTSYWTASACAEAGLVVRDVVHHIFGTGWPKSTNIAKQIDRTLGAERKVVGLRKMHDIRSNNYGHAGHRSTTADIAVTASSTDEACAWEGWGTALSPAVEHWLLCQKPLGAETIAKNVLEHGVGGLNIDGTRMPHEEEAKSTVRQANGGQTWSGADCGLRSGGSGLASADPKGRWPSNLLLSHTAECTAEGCADRFFVRLPECDPLYLYAAKPSSSERNAGCSGFYWKRDDSTLSGFVRITREEWQQLGEQQTLSGEVLRARGNVHPTVKSVALMRWLCRLITPPGGRVLDMFCGSGSTGIAALLEGFHFVGVDREADYVALAASRMECMLLLKSPKSTAGAGTQKAGGDDQGTDLLSLIDNL
jgi:hypothetical protein